MLGPMISLENMPLRHKLWFIPFAFIGIIVTGMIGLVYQITVGWAIDIYRRKRRLKR